MDEEDRTSEKKGKKMINRLNKITRGNKERREKLNQEKNNEAKGKRWNKKETIHE